jgi:protein phosphatase methylesterase 1
MSDLFRSAISSRLAKLPPDIQTYAHEEDEDEEVADSIGALPGSGMGPPAMQVSNSLTPFRVKNDLIHINIQLKAIKSYQTKS